MPDRLQVRTRRHHGNGWRKDGLIAQKGTERPPETILGRGLERLPTRAELIQR
jgi:hypothetical protein